MILKISKKHPQKFGLEKTINLVVKFHHQKIINCDAISFQCKDWHIPLHHVEWNKCPFVLSLDQCCKKVCFGKFLKSL
jgi:hypothetical protein